MSLKDVYSVSLANTGHHHNHLIKNKITFICNENFAIRSRRRSIDLSLEFEPKPNQFIKIDTTTHFVL